MITLSYFSRILAAQDENPALGGQPDFDMPQIAPAEQTDVQGSTVTNGAFLYAGAYYIITLNRQPRTGTPADAFECWKSTNQLTWTKISTSPTLNVLNVTAGSSAQLMSGATFYVFYGVLNPLTLLTFDVNTLTWTNVATFTLTVDGSPNLIRVCSAHVRSDGKIVWIFTDSGGIIGVFYTVYDPSGNTFATEIELGASIAGFGHNFFQSSFIDVSDNVHAYLAHNESSFYEQIIPPSGALPAPTFIDNTLFAWQNGAIGYGVPSGSDIYLPVSLPSGPDYVFGIAHYNGSVWSLTGSLDSAFPAGYLVAFTPLMILVGTTLLAVYTAIDTSGGAPYAWTIRYGQADISSYSSAGAWTWQTLYNLESPSPTIANLTTAKYTKILNQGSSEVCIASLFHDGTRVWYVDGFADAIATRNQAVVYFSTGSGPPPSGNVWDGATQHTGNCFG